MFVSRQNGKGESVIENQLLIRQIEKIDKMKMAELKEKFIEFYGFEAGQTNVINLRKRIIYRLQELHLGMLSEADRIFLDKIASRDLLANLRRPGDQSVSKLRGTRYNRIWKNKKYEVTVLGDGKFEFEGQTFRSLSAIARQITGTRWNGKLFFGVK